MTVLPGHQESIHRGWWYRRQDIGPVSCFIIEISPLCSTVVLNNISCANCEECVVSGCEDQKEMWEKEAEYAPFLRLLLQLHHSVCFSRTDLY